MLLESTIWISFKKFKLKFKFLIKKKIQEFNWFNGK